MAIKLSTATVNAMADAVDTATNSGSSAATIKVYDGTQPATADTAPGAGNNLLATFTLADPAFGAASGGVISLAGTPLTTTGAQAGTATWFRMESQGTGAVGTVFDGAVATTLAELNLNTTTVSVGVSIEITSGQFTMPKNA